MTFGGAGQVQEDKNFKNNGITSFKYRNTDTNTETQIQLLKYIQLFRHTNTNA